MGNKIKQWTGSTYFLLYVQILFLCLFFSYIFYKSSQNIIDNFILRTNFRIEMVEKTVENLFNNTSQVIFSLSMLLAKEPIKENNPRIIEILSSFDTKFSNYKSLPFSHFKIFDEAGKIITNSMQIEFCGSFKNESLNPHIMSFLNERTFEAQIGKLSCEKNLKIEFIPFCVSINRGSEHKGYICSGLRINEVNAMLSNVLSVQHSSRISLISRSSALNLRDIKNVFNFNNLINYYLNNKVIHGHKIMTLYPEIIIQLEANYYYLMYDLIFNTIYLVIYFIFAIISWFIIFYINNKNNKKNFAAISERLSYFPENITQISTKVKPLTAETMFKAINYTLDYCKYLYKDKENNLEEMSSLTIRNNILHLMLTEKHYSKNIITQTSLSTLYLGQMKKLIYSGFTTENLYDFLQQSSEYWSEYFFELNIKVEINKRDCKAFTFRKAALMESIFNILSLIVRSSNFETEESELILKGYFNQDNNFPNLSIEVYVQTSSVKTLGWEAGPTYVYSGFLSIHLLAKENNLIFNIIEDKKKEKIIFTLQPIAEQETLDNQYLNLT